MSKKFLSKYIYIVKTMLYPPPPQKKKNKKMLYHQLIKETIMHPSDVS